MDGQRFDELVRSLTESPSRRSLLGGLTGGVLGGVLSLFGLDDAEAAARKKKAKAKAKAKKPKKPKKPKKCPPGRKRCGTRCCRKGQVCRNKKCVIKQPTPPPPPACTPACTGKQCGSDECGGVCGPNNGGCPGTQVCSPNGICDCVPLTQPAACAGGKCGQVPDGCGGFVACGGCTAPATCQPDNECRCIPLSQQVACAGDKCGQVADGCGGFVACGGCPGNGVCQPNNQCLCTPLTKAVACAGIQCGQASDGCGGTYNCTDCEGCCDGGICHEDANINPNRCGHSGGICRDCNPEVACVSGECTCTRNSCASGCCRIVDGQPFCDNDMRPCGDTCIPKTACCHGRDYSSYSSTTPGCWGPETCSGLNGQGFGECKCGAFVCGRNDGCCSLDGNGQPFCDTSKRRCGDVCIDKSLCCHDGQQGCDDGVSCTTETCVTSSGKGTCIQDSVAGVCDGVCAAGKGFGNYFPENERDVVCGRGIRDGNNCYCWRTMDGTSEGANVCVEDGNGPACRTNGDCGTNERCIRTGLSGIEHTCAPICGQP